MAHAGGAVDVQTDDDACLTRERLAAEIALRGAQLEPGAKVRLGVHVKRTETGVAVEVTGRNERAPLSRRHLEADSCEDALTAVALIAALAVSEDAAPVDDPAPEPEPARAEVVEPRPKETTYGSFAWTASSFARGQVGPRLAVGRATRRTLFPWSELAIGATLTRTVSGGGGEAELSWIAFRGTLAPVGITLGARGMVSLYGMLETGAVVAAGKKVTTNETRTLPWLAVGVGAQLRWDLGTALIAVQAGVKVPASRDDLVFANGGTVYQMPAMGGEGAIVLGTHFP